MDWRACWASGPPSSTLGRIGEGIINNRRNPSHRRSTSTLTPIMAGRWWRGGSDGDGDGASTNLSDGSRVDMARNRRVILGLMYGYYEEALDALPLERIPALSPRLLAAGVCFGFGDPVTNIIANILCSLSGEGVEPVPEPDVVVAGRRKRKPSRDARARVEILSKIVAGDVPSPPEARTIAERSLEGLVTLLTSYYRYLPTWDALRYLCLSRAEKYRPEPGLVAPIISHRPSSSYFESGSYSCAILLSVPFPFLSIPSPDFAVSYREIFSSDIHLVARRAHVLSLTACIFELLPALFSHFFFLFFFLFAFLSKLVSFVLI